MLIWHYNPKYISVLFDYMLGFKCISFDLFDTLVTRCVPEPKNIFDMVEYGYKNQYGHGDINNFKVQRIKAEQVARETLKGEVTLDNIYCFFSTATDQKILERYKKLEIGAEMEASCLKNKNIKNLYDELIRRGKRVIITTDMYLPLYVIEQILMKNNIGGYGSIYLSCDIGETKITGRLYDHILKEESLNRSELIHMGNDFRRDYLCARKRHLHAIWMKT